MILEYQVPTGFQLGFGNMIYRYLDNLLYISHFVLGEYACVCVRGRYLYARWVDVYYVR